MLGFVWFQWIIFEFQIIKFRQIYYNIVFPGPVCRVSRGSLGPVFEFWRRTKVRRQERD